MSDELEPQEDQKRRDRSPAFPYLSLQEAVARTQDLYAHYTQHPARMKNIAPVWGFSPGSSSLLRNVAAVKSYGLIEVSGTGEDRRISISKLGNRLVNDKRPGVREDAIREAFTSCEILNYFFGKWGAKRPPTDECISELTIDMGFTSDAARKFISVYDESVSFANVQETAGGHHLIAIEADSSNNEVPLALPAPVQESVLERPIASISPEKPRNMKQDTFTLDAGDVVIQWPAGMSKENFQDFADWLEIIKRKVGRSIKADSANDQEAQ